MEIKFFDYSKLYESERLEIGAALERVLSNGHFIMQEDLLLFEKELAAYLGCKYAIGVADGTKGLTLSLIAAGIKPGDEVIISPHTFIATASSIVHAGGVPVLCDIDRQGLMDPTSIETAITPKTWAIMPTQLNGRVCDMAEICRIASERGLVVLEDSCQALGAKHNGVFAGLFGLAGSFSFYPAKTLGCFGDGGAVVTNDDKMYAKISEMRDHGRRPDGDIWSWGFNGRLDNLQAAILRVKLAKYEENRARRRIIAETYRRRLKDIDAITLPLEVEEANGMREVYQNFEIQAEKRSQLIGHLASYKIDARIQWGGRMLNQFTVGIRGNCPVSDAFSEKFLMLPLNQYITVEEAEYVCNCVEDFYS